MKLYSILLLVALLGSSCDHPSKSIPSAVTEPAVSLEEDNRQLRHVVLFQFKERATVADIDKVVEAFVDLPSKISVIKDFEWGLNNSPEGVDKGFTHCFYLTFDSEADRAIYLPHPAHTAFGELLGPFLKDVLVDDYWNE